MKTFIIIPTYNEKENIEISVVLPCRNEETALGQCLARIKEVIKKNNIKGEIIVSDSSNDRSPIIAKEQEVRLIKHDQEGYGRAYLEGFKLAKGQYIFCADADGTYDFNELPKFINYLQNGFDLVIGNRFAGTIAKNSMPWLHRYLGNPLFSFLFKLFFKVKLHDIHCGMRAISKKALDQLDLQTTGMEFASEMIIKATKQNLKIKEVPINYYQRFGQSKLKTLSDGWRHLRFMLLYSPFFLFFLPGLILFLTGIISLIWLYYDQATILGLKLYYHPMFLSSLMIIAGFQIIIFSFFAKIYAISHLGEMNKKITSLYKFFTIERTSLIGIAISLIGVLIYLIIFINWLKSGFGALSQIKNSIVALTLIAFGIQLVFSSFMLSVLGIRKK